MMSVVLQPSCQAAIPSPHMQFLSPQRPQIVRIYRVSDVQVVEIEFDPDYNTKSQGAHKNCCQPYADRKSCRMKDQSTNSVLSRITCYYEGDITDVGFNEAVLPATTLLNN